MNTTKIFPSHIVTTNLNCNYCRYLLQFQLPEGISIEQVTKHSRRAILPVSSHGGLQQWALEPAEELGHDRTWRMGIPRSWLMLYGYLPITVALRQEKAVEVRKQAQLLREFWLEIRITQTSDEDEAEPKRP